MARVKQKQKNTQDLENQVHITPKLITKTNLDQGTVITIKTEALIIDQLGIDKERQASYALINETPLANKKNKLLQNIS